METVDVPAVVVAVPAVILVGSESVIARLEIVAPVPLVTVMVYVKVPPGPMLVTLAALVTVSVLVVPVVVLLVV